MINPYYFYYISNYIFIILLIFLYFNFFIYLVSLYFIVYSFRFSFKHIYILLNKFLLNLLITLQLFIYFKYLHF